MTFRSHYYIYFWATSFFIGLILVNIFDFSWLFLYTIMLFGIIIFILNLNNKWLIALAGSIIFISLGIFRWQISWPVINQNHIAFYINKKLKINGVVLAEIEQRMNSQKIIINHINYNGKKINGKLLITAPLYPEYKYGDQLELIAKIKKPEVFDGFAYDKYLARYNIYALSYYPKIIRIKSNQGNIFYEKLLNLKINLIQRINKMLPEPEASFLGGLLWGAKRSIPKEVMDNFNATGTTHIVALSGYNISILGLIIFFLTPWFGINRKKAFWLVFGVIIFFIIITGYPASVVRAGIMGLLVLIAYQWGGGINKGILLILSAFLMCLVNPKILFYDIGFQLSFLATIGLLYLMPILAEKMNYITKRFSLQETITATLSAIILTAPLIIYQFNRFSLVSLLVNILILFVIPFTMALGFLAILTSFIWYPLGQVLAWLTYLPLFYVIKITELFGSHFISVINITNMKFWLLIFLYSLIFIYLFFANVKKNR